jgi:hypothetical protein
MKGLLLKRIPVARHKLPKAGKYLFVDPNNLLKYNTNAMVT